MFGTLYRLRAAEKVTVPGLGFLSMRAVLVAMADSWRRNPAAAGFLLQTASSLGAGGTINFASFLKNPPFRPTSCSQLRSGFSVWATSGFGTTSGGFTIGGGVFGGRADGFGAVRCATTGGLFAGGRATGFGFAGTERAVATATGAGRAPICARPLP